MNFDIRNMLVESLNEIVEEHATRLYSGSLNVHSRVLVPYQRASSRQLFKSLKRPELHSTTDSMRWQGAQFLVT